MMDCDGTAWEEPTMPELSAVPPARLCCPALQKQKQNLVSEPLWRGPSGSRSAFPVTSNMHEKGISNELRGTFLTLEPFKSTTPEASIFALRKPLMNLLAKHWRGTAPHAGTRRCFPQA